MVTCFKETDEGKAMLPSLDLIYTFGQRPRYKGGRGVSMIYGLCLPFVVIWIYSNKISKNSIFNFQLARRAQLYKSGMSLTHSRVTHWVTQKNANIGARILKLKT